MSAILETFAARSDAPEVLAAVLEKGCNLAIWQRPPVSGAQKVLERMTGDIRFTAPVTGIVARLDAELAGVGIPFGQARDIFAADAVRLTRIYADILGLDRVSVRAEIVTTNSCRKWHADYVTARLITTYVGSGTDWIDSQDAARVRQGLDPNTVHSLKAGDVGMFLGKLGSDSPAIHRSPPIAGSGERRLLLVLNPPEEN